MKRTKGSPLVHYKALEDIEVLLVLSENRSAVSFPDSEGGFDYRGFLADDDRSVSWCRDLFEYYWDRAEEKIPITSTDYALRPPLTTPSISGGRIVFEGRDDPELDPHAIQDAVDNFDEVILRGSFNLGASNIETYCGDHYPVPVHNVVKASIVVRRSVIIRGEGRVDDVPSTKVYKSGWTYPSPINTNEILFYVNGDGADVTIENIHFTDFNATCLGAEQGNSLKILKNRITLETGIGRGIRYGPYGDIIVGILPAGHFLGGVLIEGNYLDFAHSYLYGGSLYDSGLSDDPEYRPDVTDYTYCRGIGISLIFCKGKVVIRKNVIRNMNARGIAMWDNYETAKVYVEDNVIESDIYGTYPYFTSYAGIGILAQSSHQEKMPGFYVEIEKNKVRCGKVNYCGIAVLGGLHEGTGKLRGGFVEGNEVHLDDGSVGIMMSANEGFNISDNTLSGKAYYGVQISGREPTRSATDNIVSDNSMTNLEIKTNDQYSDRHTEGEIFAYKSGRSKTANYWLGSYTSNNAIKLNKDDIIIDEGQKNSLTYVED